MYLRECLESILASREGHEKQVEIVISDNASTDDTASVVQEFQCAHPNIVYSCNAENIGGDPNILKAAQLGRGEYIWVFGDDDKLDKSAMGAVIARIGRGCNIAILNFSVHSADFSRRSRAAYYSRHIPQQIREHGLVLEVFGTSLGLISAIVMHRKIVQAREDDRLLEGERYNYPFLLAIYTDVKRECGVEFIPEPLVLNRSGNAPDEEWNRRFCKNMALLVADLSAVGYSRASIRAAKNRTIRRYIGWRIVRQKMEGGPWCDIFVELWKYYRECWGAWLLCLPLVPLPGAVLRSMRSAKRLFTG